MPKDLATFKSAPTKTLLIRPGPVQCVRNCTNCILQRNYDEDAEAENVIAIKSFDDLVGRQSIWVSRYQTIQYQLGQVDVLRQTLETIEPTLVIYVVATTRLRDIDYFKKILTHERLPSATTQMKDFEPTRLDPDSRTRYYIVPIRLVSCATDAEMEKGFLDANGLKKLLEPLVIRSQSFESNLRVAFVPVIVSKDHDKATLFGIGSICTQIMQPYPLKEYLENAKTEQKSAHIVQHLYHDLSRYGARLPCNLVALLLVYLERPCGVSRADLVEYMQWFRKSAMEFDLHLAFTGKTDAIIDFALLILEDYVHYDAGESVYRTKNIEALNYYASPLIPNLAYYGLISRAILMLHNRDDKNVLLSRFSAGVGVKVMRDDMLELVEDMAKKLDSSIPCRRPCVDFKTSIMASFNSMITFGKYFKIQEARARQCKKLGWLGDYDSDEEWYLTKQNDPAFKPWIILTQRPYRLDRLNLFINVMEAYIEWITCTSNSDVESGQQNSSDN